MAASTVALSPNGTKSPNGHPRKGPARVVPLLGQKIDDLLGLRALLRRAQDEERKLTGEVLGALQAVGADRVEGREAVAVIDARTTLKPDPTKLYAALGARAFEAMTVSVTAARRLMAEEALVAISETTTSPVLRVEAIEPRASAA